MWLVVGLGNPGKQYSHTRHNVGFMAVDILSSNLRCSISHKPKFNAEISQGNIDSCKLILCKPTTFMNLSGKAVGALSSYYKIPLERIIVIHDDIDLNFARLKYKIGGGSAGHNGLRSVNDAIGRDYHRIRIGVGRSQDHRISTSDFVLAKFPDQEKQEIMAELNLLSQNIKLLVNGNVEEFKTALSQNTRNI